MRSTKDKKTSKPNRRTISGLTLVSTLGLFLCSCFTNTYAQRYCGRNTLLEHHYAKHPETQEQIRQLRENAVEKVIEQAKKAQAISQQTKSTRTRFLVPVVFHFLLDSTDLIAIGGTSGIEARISSQIQSLNLDFNGQNTDRVKVPEVWQDRYADVGVFFCIADKDLSGNAFKGYDLKIVPTGTSYSADNGAIDAKQNTSIGTAPWDNTRYLNIWVCKLRSGLSTVLGVTVPPNYPGFSAFEKGIAVNWLAFGKRTSPTQIFQKYIDQGRTLTHEMGHYFYLEHTWGDDGGLCPGSGGTDDGISDTPPEADEQYGFPSFPKFDACSPSGNGVMFMNYMDYVNDSAMYIFTKQQALVMQAQLNVGGYSYSLTQNEVACDTQIITQQKVIIYPNPSTGVLKWLYAIADYPASRIVFHNVLGQKLLDIDPQNSTEIDLSHWSKGFYFISFYFDSEQFTYKFILNP